MKTLKEMLVSGNKIRIYYNEGNPNNRLIHIRAIVDEAYIVFCVWSRRRGYYMYQVESMCYFELLYEGRSLLYAGKDID